MIRLATIEDFDACAELGKAMHEEGWFSFLEFSPEKIKRMGEHYMKNENCLFIVATDKCSNVIGMFMGFVGGYFFGDSVGAFDVVWYVGKNHRGSTAGIRLLDEYTEWARSKGAKEVGIGVWAGIAGVDVDSILKRRGFNRVGGNFKMRIT